MSVNLGSISIKITLFCIFIAISGHDAIAVQPSDYIQPEVCGGCHSEIYAQWNGSMHAVAHKDPVYLKLFVIASKETNSTFDEFCTKCHSPISIITGEKPSADNYKVSEVAEKGISCDFCHTINASTGIANGAFVSSPGKIKYGPFDDSNYSTFHKTAYSELYTKAEFCGMCHDVNHPFNGLPLETTYTEWKQGSYNQTTPCQDCHMTPGITKFMKNPGRAAAGGPIREQIFTHYFVGGNAMIPGLLGSPEHETLAKERLRSAATLEIENIEQTNETIKFNVKVTNVGAGHKIPTGLTEARMVWLNIDVRDKTGKKIFSSGEMDKDNYIEENAVVYHTVLGDSSGKPTMKVWLADRILSDNRIPPKGQSIETFTFNVPKEAVGPLNISAKLNYISATQELADELFGKGVIKPPVVEMASANASIITEMAPTPNVVPGFEFFFLAMALLISYATIKITIK